MRTFPYIKDLLAAIRHDVSHILTACAYRIPSQLEDLQNDMETVRWLAENERKKKESKYCVLWVTRNPNTGTMEHKFTSFVEVKKFLGGQYGEALDYLEKANVGEAVYIDGALFMHLEIYRESMTTRRFNLHVKEES